MLNILAQIITIKNKLASSCLLHLQKKLLILGVSTWTGAAQIVANVKIILFYFFQIVIVTLTSVNKLNTQVRQVYTVRSIII